MTATQPPESAPGSASRRFWLAWGIMLAGISCLVLFYEITRYLIVLQDERPLVTWIARINADTSPYFLWLLILPLFYRLRFHLFDPDGTFVQSLKSWAGRGRYAKGKDLERDGRTRWMLPLMIGLLGLFNSASMQQVFEGLPPAFHDEYSYLFQAETFLQGRIANPRFEQAPRLFDQMHVLNDSPGHFVSRYFPGTGLWLTPFVAWGIPYWGYAIAHGIFCSLIGMIGRDLGGNGVGSLSGLLAAFMPGPALFSTLLLAHHPCLMGLALFLFAYHRFHLSRNMAYGVLAAVGLAYAMWCRPMTAFGVSLPYAIHFLVVEFRGRTSFPRFLIHAASLAGPILIGLLLLLPYNAATTGDPLMTPYQQYTQLHTPRHVYGFNNVVRGEAWIQSQREEGTSLPVIEHYDTWAENLTPSLAWNNELNRLLATGQWTLGIVPALATLIFFCSASHQDRPLWWMIPLSILSLHLVHIPYWYDGILHWHYVMEAAPLLALMFARSTRIIVEQVQKAGRHWLIIWWFGLVSTGLTTAYTTFEPFWSSQLAAGMSELAFARNQHAEVTRFLDENTEKPAVVFIQRDPTDQHLDFVVNSPTLDDPLLRAHWLPARYSLAELKRIFPEREPYYFNAESGQFLNLSQLPEQP